MALHGVTEAAKLAGVSRQTVYNALKSGSLSYSNNGEGHKQIDTAELERWKGSLTVGVQPDAQLDNTGHRKNADLTPEIDGLRREIDLLRQMLDEAREREQEARQREKDQREDYRAALRLLPAPTQATATNATAEPPRVDQAPNVEPESRPTFWQRVRGQGR